MLPLRIQSRERTIGYRLYHFDRDDRIIRGEWIEAQNDKDALAQAGLRKRPMLCTRCELWKQMRLVSALECGETEL